MKLRLALWSLFAAVLVPAVSNAQHLGIRAHNLPPAERLMHPGPGVTGPGPGVLAPAPPVLPAMAGAVASQTIQVLFGRPEGMQIRWDVGAVGQFDSEPLIVPGRQNFPEGGIYRLKLTNVPGPGREGVELYPTLEIAPSTPRTIAYLAHNAVPIQFTEEDFDQVQSGNFVTKVIYLPDPEFQEMALAGVETLVSTRLDPGVDPIVEADRRGSIMAILRLGNKDIEMPGTTADPVLTASYLSAASPAAMSGAFGCGGGRRRLTPGFTPPLRFGSDGPGMGHADERDTDWTARSASHSVWKPRRLAEARDAEPHVEPPAWSDRTTDNRCAADAWIQLSPSGQPRDYSGTVPPPEPAVPAAAGRTTSKWCTKSSRRTVAALAETGGCRGLIFSGNSWPNRYHLAQRDGNGSWLVVVCHWLRQCTRTVDGIVIGP